MKAFGGAVQAQFRQVDDMLRADQSADWQATMNDLKSNYAPPPKLEDATRPAVVFPQN